ncbi:MAG TPA: hypothetical protein VKX45_04800 [Bryobacteraceae bacterium]|nr:hypothetical protein [Bryobacteraceae bacterium]
MLLSLFEGKTIEFEVRLDDGSVRMVNGRIIRSGYVPHYGAYQRYGAQYQYSQNVSGMEQPVIEVDGKLQFSLPGQLIFPDNTILKPTLDWIIHSGERAKFDAELSYVSGGMSWSADYNAVAPENGDTLDLDGWVTLDNQSGKQFDHAPIKLMAGDVNKIHPQQAGYNVTAAQVVVDTGAAPRVNERNFDDYHSYTLPNPTTLHDRETRQVEFLRASGIPARRLYVYDGAALSQSGMGDLRYQANYGTQSDHDVWTMLEFANSSANHLTDQAQRFVDESLEVKLRNHKKEPVTVRVVEHLYRWSNWTSPPHPIPTARPKAAPSNSR